MRVTNLRAGFQTTRRAFLRQKRYGLIVLVMVTGGNLSLIKPYDTDAGKETPGMGVGGPRPVTAPLCTIAMMR